MGPKRAFSVVFRETSATTTEFLKFLKISKLVLPEIGGEGQFLTPSGANKIWLRDESFWASKTSTLRSLIILVDLKSRGFSSEQKRFLVFAPLEKSFFRLLFP